MEEKEEREKKGQEERELWVGFVGNPNCGKTTLFNAYTGARLKVANWPGVTVEKKEGAMKYHSHRFRLVDLPGIYSLTSYTMEEKLTRQFILEDEVDVIVDVADASALERNLYLTLQLIELGKPVVLALNMMDIVQERGMEIDLHRLPEMLGVPCIPVSARKRTGLQILMHTVAHHREKRRAILEHQHPESKKSRHRHDHHNEYAMVYDDVIEDKIDEITDRLKAEGFECPNYRWYALKLLEQDEEITARVGCDLADIVDHSYETDIINQKYDFIEEIIEECLVGKQAKAATTDRVDRLLTHRYLGLPMFLGIMAVVFFLTFFIGDWLKGYFENFLEWFSSAASRGLAELGVHKLLISLLVDGIISGVGGILTFLPNIFILFLALAFLEDSGYMSRVAYVMDGLMGRLGLSGRAFIPMVLGFGCSVPAVMASRALEDPVDRRRTVFVTPFMSCSAKLPVYVLFSQMFFGKYAMFAAFSMYLLGLVVGILTAFLLKGRKTSRTAENPLLIELPEYKTPNARTIAIYVWEKVKDYLTKAGTTIFLASIVVWFALNFGPRGMAKDMQDSFGALLGKAVTPVLATAGLGLWQIALALISGLAAKEVVVSSLSVLFGIANISSASGMSELTSVLAGYGFGALNAYALMVFVLLYTPCVATIGVIRRELKSAKWTAATIGYQLFAAWLLSTVVYQVGKLFL
ncbi:MAG: ferrous iron transport protein B [Lachnospiraceae bacterium]|nr:ferrous iron transport protein B [Lachnospiraceae bacterium]